ncbi:hypothetical protein VTL71DRAFT_7326 [Oculimacula yallundae]|uniref:Uncharacterized protein n=1 Tax=Oculimacula yallundae TaxID=86028 RepID=A0ABR4BWD5_9HELO
MRIEIWTLQLFSYKIITIHHHHSTSIASNIITHFSNHHLAINQIHTGARSTMTGIFRKGFTFRRRKTESPPPRPTISQPSEEDLDLEKEERDACMRYLRAKVAEREQRVGKYGKTWDGMGKERTRHSTEQQQHDENGRDSGSLISNLNLPPREESNLFDSASRREGVSGSSPSAQVSPHGVGHPVAPQAEGSASEPFGSSPLQVEQMARRPSILQERPVHEFQDDPLAASGTSDEPQATHGNHIPGSPNDKRKDTDTRPAQDAVCKPKVDSVIDYKLMIREINDSSYPQIVKTNLAIELVGLLQEFKAEAIQEKDDSVDEMQVVIDRWEMVHRQQRTSSTNVTPLHPNQELIDGLESFSENPMTKYVIAQLKRDKETTKEARKLLRKLENERKLSEGETLVEDKGRAANSTGTANSEEAGKSRNASQAAKDSQSWATRTMSGFRKSNPEKNKGRRSVTDPTLFENQNEQLPAPQTPEATPESPVVWPEFRRPSRLSRLANKLSNYDMSGWDKGLANPAPYFR